MARLPAAQVFVEGEMVVFGYGGFYERPKGWGLDVCYFHKREFAWWRGRRRLWKRLQSALQHGWQSGQLMHGFVPQFVRRLQRHVEHEWHFDRAELMFQAAKARSHTLSAYEDFPAFIRMVLAGRPFCTPLELEQRVRDYLLTVFPGEDPLERVESQNYLLFGFLLRTIEADICALIGDKQGSQLFNQLLELAPLPPRDAPSLDEFLYRLLRHGAALDRLAQWHMQYFSRLLERQTQIRQTLRKLRVVPSRNKLAARALRATRRESRLLPPTLVQLMVRLKLPVFIATGADLSYFSAFHQPGYLVHRQSGEMHQMVGLGLCAHRPQAGGAVFVTYPDDNLPRFRHTLLEECTHFADGPHDRMRLSGAARYSGSAEFRAAFAADYDRHAAWRNSRALGLREWGVILTQMRFSARRMAALQQQIERYNATLDFRHYAEEEQLAEIFAALPVIECAVGRKVARAVLPNMFRYYEQQYPQGLKAEIHALRQ